MNFCDVNPFVRHIIHAGTPHWEHYFRKGTDCRIFYVEKGCMTINIDGKEHKIASGGLIYIPSGVEYALIDYTSDFTHYLVNFDFTQDFCRKEKAFFPGPSEEFDKSEIIAVPKIQGFDFFQSFIHIKHYTAIGEIIHELFKSYSDRRIMYRHENSAHMKRILSKIAECKLSNMESSSETIANSAILYIKRNYNNPLLNNESLSKHLGYNSFYINKTIKQITGKSIHKYLLSYRLLQAESLLLYSEKSISEIALLCGFSEYDVFYSAFKREYGQTPTRFRKDNRKN